jgi:hypothetical protein
VKAAPGGFSSPQQDAPRFDDGGNLEHEREQE